MATRHRFLAGTGRLRSIGCLQELQAVPLRADRQCQPRVVVFPHGTRHPPTSSPRDRKAVWIYGDGSVGLAATAADASSVERGAIHAASWSAGSVGNCREVPACRSLAATRNHHPPVFLSRLLAPAFSVADVAASGRVAANLQRLWHVVRCRLCESWLLAVSRHYGVTGE